MSGCGIGGMVVDPEFVGAVVVDAEITVDLGAGQGIAGPPGTGVTTVRTFTLQSVWNVVHNLGRFPSVTTVETSGDQVLGDLTYLDANTLRVTFSVPVSGIAYLN